jgi:hypothetical protein
MKKQDLVLVFPRPRGFVCCVCEMSERMGMGKSKRS